MISSKRLYAKLRGKGMVPKLILGAKLLTGLPASVEEVNEILEEHLGVEPIAP